MATIIVKGIETRMAQFDFIRPEILARLKAGQFVPVRNNKGKISDNINKQSVNQSGERRNNLSPLAITKQCIRYEPRVFIDRRDTILKIAKGLNNPDLKIMMLQGDQGSGKTSLVRGVIELMGGKHSTHRSTQLLWFDANRYTDFNDITQFLIQYITYLSEASRPSSGFKIPKIDSSSPIKTQLSRVLETMADVPLLIVLDNMEYLVNSQLQLNSPPFKELLNFLLQFDNIKMMMLGERLPYKDLAPSLLVTDTATLPFQLDKSPEPASHLDEIKLLGLSEAHTQDWLLEKVRQTFSSEQLHQLYQFTQGYPWLIKTVLYLNQKAKLPIENILESIQEKNALEALSELIYQHLDPIHRQIVQLLILVRHPLDSQALAKILPVCFPGQANFQQSLQQLEQSILRPVLKINYAPQEVIRHIQARQEQSKENKQHSEQEPFLPAYDLYHAFKKIRYRLMSPFERLRLHEALHTFYAQESKQSTDKEDSAKEVLGRLNKKSCVAEANFHLQMAQKVQQSSDAVIVNNSESAPISVSPHIQAYQSSQDLSTVEALKPRHSLDDYRKIIITDENSDTNNEPILLTHENITSDVSWEHLLTDEEKQILGLQPQDFRAAQANSSEIIEIVPNSQKPTFNTDLKTDATLSETKENYFTLPRKLSADLYTHHIPDDLYQDNEHLKQLRQQMTQAVASRNKSEFLRQLLALADFWISHQEWGRAEECLQKVLTLDEAQQKQRQDEFTVEKDSLFIIPESLLAQAWYQRGLLFQRQYKLSDATVCFQHAYQRLQTIIQNLVNQDINNPNIDNRDQEHLSGLIAQQLADGYGFQHHREQAILWQQRALVHLEKAVNDINEQYNPQSLLLLSEGYFKLGQFLDDEGQFSDSIQAYQKSLEKNQTLNTEAAAAAMNNIGQLYAEQEHFEDAIHWLQQTLAFDRESGQDDAVIKTLENIAIIYEAWADQALAEENTDQSNDCMSKAQAILEDALTLAKQSLNQPPGKDEQQKQKPWRDHPQVVLSNLYVSMAHFYERQNETEQALQCFQKAIQTGEHVLSNQSLQYLSRCIQNLTNFPASSESV